jgi:hypothetical protein
MVEKVDETLSSDDTGLDGSGELGERLYIEIGGGSVREGGDVAGTRDG